MGRPKLVSFGLVCSDVWRNQSGPFVIRFQKKDASASVRISPLHTRKDVHSLLCSKARDLMELTMDKVSASQERCESASVKLSTDCQRMLYVSMKAVHKTQQNT